MFKLFIFVLLSISFTPAENTTTTMAPQTENSDSTEMDRPGTEPFGNIKVKPAISFEKVEDIYVTKYTNSKGEEIYIEKKPQPFGEWAFIIVLKIGAALFAVFFPIRLG